MQGTLSDEEKRALGFGAERKNIEEGALEVQKSAGNASFVAFKANMFWPLVASLVFVCGWFLFEREKMQTQLITGDLKNKELVSENEKLSELVQLLGKQKDVQKVFDENEN